MTDNVNKMFVGLALAALAGLPAFAQDPSPDCDDDEIFVGGECKEIDDIVTGTRDGSSGGQSGLGGGTGSTSSGSSNNGYSGRPGGSSGGSANGGSGEQGDVDWQEESQRIWDATYGQTATVLQEVICSPFSTVATTTVGITEGTTAVNHASQGRPHMARPSAGRAGLVAVLAGVLTEGCP